MGRKYAGGKPGARGHPVWYDWASLGLWDELVVQVKRGASVRGRQANIYQSVRLAKKRGDIPDGYQVYTKCCSGRIHVVRCG